MALTVAKTKPYTYSAGGIVSHSKKRKRKKCDINFILVLSNFILFFVGTCVKCITVPPDGSDASLLTSIKKTDGEKGT